MANKKKFEISIDDVMAVLILAFVLGMLAYIFWEDLAVALTFLILSPLFAPAMSTLFTRENNSTVIKQYRGWSDPKQ